MSHDAAVVVLLLPMLVTTLAQQCDRTAQSTIRSCAHELTELGIFTSTQRLSTFDKMRQESKDYFERICDAFDRCLGGEQTRTVCWTVEPVKSEFAVADAALDYICNDGYFAMLAHWDCYLRSASRSDVAVCEQRVSVDSNRQLGANGRSFNTPFQQGNVYCSAMQNYVACIREPISMTCGQDAWHNVVQAIERPLQVYLPYCTLGSGALYHAPQLLLIFLAVICAIK